MKCVRCGHEMKSTRGPYRYAESGLSNVTLLNVERRECSACGEREVVIPRIEQLHQTIARAVMLSPTHFSSEEVRFLRKWLGYSLKEFARVVGVRFETVSRWESQHAGYPIPEPAERLVRLLVANREPTTYFPIEQFTHHPRGKPDVLKFQAPDWKRAA